MCKIFFIYCALRGFEPMTSRWMYTLYFTCGSGNYSLVWESMDYESKIRISKLQLRLEAVPASYHPLIWSKYYSLLIQCIIDPTHIHVVLNWIHLSGAKVHLIVITVTFHWATMPHFKWYLLTLLLTSFLKGIVWRDTLLGPDFEAKTIFLFFFVTSKIFDSADVDPSLNIFKSYIKIKNCFGIKIWVPDVSNLL